MLTSIIFLIICLFLETINFWKIKCNYTLQVNIDGNVGEWKGFVLQALHHSRVSKIIYLYLKFLCNFRGVRYETGE